jgi:hypothetical protein
MCNRVKTLRKGKAQRTFVKSVAFFSASVYYSLKSQQLPSQEPYPVERDSKMRKEVQAFLYKALAPDRL